MATDAIVVYVTAPSAEKAAEIGRALVEAGHAACGNIIPGIRSIYRWKGKIEDESEALLILKTRKQEFEALRDRVQAMHPYDVPEVIAVPIEAGSEKYLEWVIKETS
jgi:periplasmic divalent cation tolerance protein